jgi:hypothetical protein
VRGYKQGLSRQHPRHFWWTFSNSESPKLKFMPNVIAGRLARNGGARVNVEVCSRPVYVPACYAGLSYQTPSACFGFSEESRRMFASTSREAATDISPGWSERSERNPGITLPLEPEPAKRAADSQPDNGPFPARDSQPSQRRLNRVVQRSV